MKINVVMCEVFSQISDEQYENYRKSIDGIKHICPTSSWDLLEHSDKENHTYIRLYQSIYHHAISTIIFQALAVEAFVNYYGIKKISEQTFALIDKKESNIIKKMKRLLKELEISYSDDLQLFKDVKELFDIRNRLVHYKTKPLTFKAKDFENKDFELAFNAMEHEQIDFVMDNIDDKVNVYRNLKSQISKLDGTNIDFIESENRAFQDFMDAQLCEMLRKVFGDKTSI